FDFELICLKGCLHLRITTVKALLNSLQTSWRDQPALSSNPTIQRPTVRPRCYQPARINNAAVRLAQRSQNCPIPMINVDVSKRVTAEHKSLVCRIKLAFNPVRPNPVPI